MIAHKPTGSFVQFAGQGAHGMRAEAVSNTYRSQTAQLPSSACDRLLKLGWLEPTYVPVKGEPEPPDGSANFYLDAAVPVPYSKLAALAVESLRDAYRVRHPGELEYEAYGDHAPTIRFPSLKIKRRDSRPTAVPSVSNQTPLPPKWAEWKVVVEPTEPGALVLDQADGLVARVFGQSDDEALGRALLIARAPALRDATHGALQVFRLIAKHEAGAAGLSARDMIPALEAALAGAGQ